MAKDYNDKDVKFVRDMIPHHQMAVDMSAAVYHNGQNAQVKEWAKAIWNKQKAEIDQFKRWLAARSL